MKQCVCEHPILILNPCINELVALHRNITIRGHKTTFYNCARYLYEFRKSAYHPDLLKITPADLDNCFIEDRSTEKTYPVYIQVPCGHCVVCRNSKVNSFVHRCKLETMSYNSKPLFLTLTYDETKIKQDGVCLRDVQLFFKRLRISLHRKGYRQKIRFVLVAEYGRRTKRAHYHAILWNLQATSLLSFESIKQTIEESWRNGFVMLRFVEPANDKAFYYTAKYLRKDCDTPEGCNPTFMVSSNRGGGIGAPFLARFKKHIARTLNTDLKYVNKWSGKTEKVQFNRYVLDKLLPSLSKSLPYSLKCRVRRFLYYYSILDKRGSVNSYMFDRVAQAYYDSFKDYFFVYLYGKGVPKEQDYSLTDNAILRQMLQDEIYIDDYLSKHYGELPDAVYYSSRREPFLEKLFSDVHEINIPHRAYTARRSAAMAAQRELL